MPGSHPAPGAEGRREHWQRIYGKHAVDEVSWYQERPATSLALVRRAAAPPAASVIDVGGGASRLVDGLLEAGYRQVAVLDVSDTALARARARLGERAARVEWIAADVTRWRPPRTFDVWHDRAAFHFLVDPADRAAYREALAAAVPAGGHVIIGTFALDGPERCSDLPVVRYDATSLQAELGAAYRLVETLAEDHRTPSGKVQRFQFSRFERR
jgi:SAM-dependent methyltransferase